MPINLGSDKITAGIPGGDLIRKRNEVRKRFGKSLTGHDINLDFGDIEPRTVLRGKMPVETVGDSVGFLGRKSLVERGNVMSIEVVGDESDFFGGGVQDIGSMPENMGEIDGCPCLGHDCVALAGKRLENHETTYDTLPFFHVLLTCAQFEHKLKSPHFHVCFRCF